MSKKRKIELIDWVDSSGANGWHKPQKKHPELIINSVGWVAKETKRYLTLVGHIDDVYKNHHSAMTIPKCAIVRRRRFKG